MSAPATETVALRAALVDQVAEVERLRAALTDALDGMEDMRSYVPDFAAVKWGHDGYIERAQAALAGRGDTPDEGIADVSFARGYQLGRLHGRESAAKEAEAPAEPASVQPDSDAVEIELLPGGAMRIGGLEKSPTEPAPVRTVCSLCGEPLGLIPHVEC